MLRQVLRVFASVGVLGLLLIVGVGRSTIAYAADPVRTNNDIYNLVASVKTVAQSADGEATLAKSYALQSRDTAAANNTYLRNNVMDRLLPAKDAAVAAETNSWGVWQEVVNLRSTFLRAADDATAAKAKADEAQQYAWGGWQELVNQKATIKRAADGADAANANVSTLRTEVQDMHDQTLSAIAAIQVTDGGGTTQDFALLSAIMERVASAMERLGGPDCVGYDPTMILVPPGGTVGPAGDCAVDAEQSATEAQKLRESMEDLKDGVVQAVNDVTQAVQDSAGAGAGGEVGVKQAVEDAEQGIKDAVADAKQAIKDAIDRMADLISEGPAGRTLSGSVITGKLNAWTSALGCLQSSLSGVSGTCGGGPTIHITAGVDFQPLGYCPTLDASSWSNLRALVGALVIMTAAFGAFRFITAGLSYSRGA